MHWVIEKMEFHKFSTADYRTALDLLYRAGQTPKTQASTIAEVLYIYLSVQEKKDYPEYSLRPEYEMVSDEVAKRLEANLNKLKAELEADPFLTEDQIKKALHYTNLQPIANPDGKTWRIGFVVDPRRKRRTRIDGI